MTPENHRRSGLLRILVLAAAGAAFLAGGNLLVKNSIRNRIREIDPLASFAHAGYGVNTVFLGGLAMPGRGISAESVWVILQGASFNPVPSRVIMKGVTVTPVGNSPPGPGEDHPVMIPPLSVENGILPDGTGLYASRAGGVDHISMEGAWGTLHARRENGIFTAVFKDVTGVPLADRPFPGIMDGRALSGICTGTISSDSVVVQGSITALDGEPASAIFHYSLLNGVSDASFHMDFSQISRPAIALLSSATGGAVMAAVPSGSLHVSLGETDSVLFSTTLIFDSVEVFSSSIAPDTFSIGVGLECSGSLFPESGSISIDSGSIRLEKAVVGFMLDYGGAVRRKLVLNLFSRSLSGEDISASVPPS